jgi:hypothetical protein
VADSAGVRLVDAVGAVACSHGGDVGRLSVRCEDPEAGAALLGQLHRFADQIGMTTAGLAEMGWRVAVDEVATKAAAAAPAQPAAPRARRLRVADAQ